MSNINSVAISGFLAGDPEKRWESEDGESGIVRLGVVVKKSRKDGDEWVEDSSIYDVEVFGKFALLVERKLQKYDNVAIQGRLEKDEWEAEDGSKRSKVKVVATAIDSEGFFRKQDEEKAPSEQPAEKAAAGATPTNDDIPF